MTYKVVIERSAEEDFAAAAGFYEGFQAGLGQRFTQEVLAVFRRASLNPEMFPMATGRVRKAKIPNWPYSFYFTIKPAAAELVISTIWHGSRDPAELRRRLT